MSSTSPSQCPNCREALEERYKFCPQCGQKTYLHRLNWHDIVHDAVHYFTHADKGIFRLIKELAVRTGKVAKEYVQGQRKKYFLPLNFFLLVAAIFVFMTNVFERYTPTDRASQQVQIEKMRSPQKREMMRRIYERQGKAVGFIGKYSNFVSMVSTPLLTLVIWAFYARGKYNYVEHLVANLYASGFTNLIYSVLVIPVAYWLGIQGASLTLAAIYFLFEIIYRSVFYYRFMDRGTTASAVKATLACFTAIAFWFFFSAGLVGLYIYMGLR